MGSWSVPEPLAAKLSHANRAVPNPVKGLLLIDTGASHPCIGAEVASELQLPATSIGKTFGAGGLHRNPEFLASLSFRLPLAAGGLGTITREAVALSIPDLNQQFERAAERTLPQGPTWRLIGLIGRDLLQSMTFSLHGPSGRFTLAVHS